MDEKYAVGLIGDLAELRGILESVGIECIAGGTPTVAKAVRSLSEETGRPVPVLVEDPEREDKALQRWCSIFPAKTGNPLVLIRQGDIEMIQGADLLAVNAPVAVNDILARAGLPGFEALDGQTFPPGAFVPSQQSTPVAEEDDELAQLEREMEAQEFETITSGAGHIESSPAMQSQQSDMHGRNYQADATGMNMSAMEEAVYRDPEAVSEAHWNQAREQSPAPMNERERREPELNPQGFHNEQGAQQKHEDQRWQNDQQGAVYEQEYTEAPKVNQNAEPRAQQYRQPAEPERPWNTNAHQEQPSRQPAEPEQPINGYADQQSQRNDQFSGQSYGAPQDQQWPGNQTTQDQGRYGYPPNDQQGFSPYGQQQGFNSQHQGYGQQQGFNSQHQGYGQQQGFSPYSQQQGFNPQHQEYGQQQAHRAFSQQELGNAIVVLSPKGGVGKTSTSLQLAYEAGKAGMKVMLIDGNSGQGDLMGMVGLERSGLPTIQDASLNNDVGVCFIQPEQINHYRSHDADQATFGFVAAPLGSTNQRGDVDNLFYAKVIEEARRRADLVIIDTQILESDDKTGVVEDLWAPIIKSPTGWAIAVTECSAVSVNSLETRLAHLTSVSGIPASKFMTLFNRVDMDDMGEVVDGYGRSFRGYGEVLGAIPQSREAKMAMDEKQFELDTPLFSERVLKALLRVDRTPALLERRDEIESILAGPEKEPNFFSKLIAKTFKKK